MEHTRDWLSRLLRAPGRLPDALAYRRRHFCHFPTDRRMPSTTGAMRRAAPARYA
jgi:hypothetical protein